MHRARRGFAAASLVLAASTSTTATRAADKVRCTAAYEQGQELRRQDKLSASRSQLLICEQTCPQTLAADCTRWQSEVEALMPTVRLRARDPRGQPTEARVFVDGALLLDQLVDTPVPVDSGDHTFRFESPSGVTADVRVCMAASGHGRSRPSSPLLPSPRRAPAAPFPSRRTSSAPWALQGSCSAEGSR